MCIDARKTSLTGVQNSKQNRLAATRLVDKCDMCIDARKTSLTGVQNSNKKIGSPLRGSWICDMCIDARKTSLTGVKNSKKKKKSGSPLHGSDIRRFAARGRCSASSLGQTPLGKKARSAPGGGGGGQKLVLPPPHFFFYWGATAPRFRRLW